MSGIEQESIRELCPESIPLGSNRLVLGRGSTCGCVISHISVSREHAAIQRRDSITILSDLGSSKGTYVNGVQVKEKQLQNDDLIQFGQGPTYRFERVRLILVEQAGGMSLRLINAGRCLADHQWLLRHVSVSVQSGSLVGIIGPSGSGKSVLIECLAALSPLDQGAVVFDDDCLIENDLERYRKDIAYVSQDDLVYRLLTVLENMQLAVAVRLPGLRGDDRQARITEAMHRMQLSGHSDKLAGSLSGGQRKRLCIAMELIRHPRLLILDEPTSGLDSGLQVEVMDVLRSVSRRGTTVICSTHTLDTLNYLDQVIAIGKMDGVGTLAFAGAPGDLLESFQARDPAELYRRLEVLASNAGAGNDQANSDGASRQRIENSTPISSNGVTEVEGNAARESFGRRKLTDDPWQELIHQGKHVCGRSLLELSRDVQGLLLNAAQPLVLAMIVVVSQHAQMSSSFIHFFLIVSAIWMGMSLTVRELVRERRVFIRDHHAGLVPLAYLGGKFTAALPPIACQVVVLYVMTHLLIQVFIPESHGITRSGLVADESFVRALLILFMAGVAGLLIGMSISAVARTERSAVALLPLLLLPQMLFSRVSYGDGGKGWGYVSPFAPVLKLPQYFNGDIDPGGVVVSLLSLLLVSRPMLVILDYRDGEFRWIMGDVLLAILLLAAHAALLLWLFLTSGRSVRLR